MMMAEYINREAAIEAIMNQRLYYTFGNPNSNQGAYNMVKRIMLLDAVKRIPAADVRPVVRGKWVTREDVAPFKPDGEITSWSYKCSECGSLSRLKDNYCHNCGADMRGMENEKA